MHQYICYNHMGKLAYQCKQRGKLGLGLNLCAVFVMGAENITNLLQQFEFYSSKSFSSIHSQFQLPYCFSLSYMNINICKL